MEPFLFSYSETATLYFCFGKLANMAYHVSQRSRNQFPCVPLVDLETHALELTQYSLPNFLRVSFNEKTATLLDDLHTRVEYALLRSFNVHFDYVHSCWHHTFKE